jgi:DNA-binding transcriptional ArsR family regulator
VTVSYDIFDVGLLKALGHPLRLQILDTIVNTDEVSPVDLSRELDVPVATVSRHIRILRDLGYLELTRTVPRRGAVQHYYRAVRVPFIDDADWEELPIALRRGMAAQVFRKLFREASAAGCVGGFDPPGMGIARVPLELDDEGLRELADAVKDLLRRADGIRAACDARRAGGPRDAKDVVASRLAVMHFQLDERANPSGPGGEHPPLPTAPPRFA